MKEKNNRHFFKIVQIMLISDLLLTTNLVNAAKCEGWVSVNDGPLICSSWTDLNDCSTHPQNCTPVPPAPTDPGPNTDGGPDGGTEQNAPGGVIELSCDELIFAKDDQDSKISEADDNINALKEQANSLNATLTEMNGRLNQDDYNLFAARASLLDLSENVELSCRPKMKNSKSCNKAREEMEIQSEKVSKAETANGILRAAATDLRQKLSSVNASLNAWQNKKESEKRKRQLIQNTMRRKDC